jgi:hypothetical protein
MSHPLKHFFRFCLLVAIQVLLLNKINLRWWWAPSGFPLFIPYIYPLVILLMPFSTRLTPLLVIAFLLGTSVDVFSNTLGMHASACVLMAYLRPNVLAALLPKNLVEYHSLEPSVRTMSWLPFFTYAAVLLLAHHLLLFLVEFWSVVAISALLLKVLSSLVTSLLLLLIYTLLATTAAPVGNNRT